MLPKLVTLDSILRRSLAGPLGDFWDVTFGLGTPSPTTVVLVRHTEPVERSMFPPPSPFVVHQLENVSEEKPEC